VRDAQRRALGSRAILEALTAVYAAEQVADELLGGAIAVRGADAGVAVPAEVPAAE
jgi:hypothetical protein